MSNLNYTSFVKRHKLLHRLMYWIIFSIGVIVCFVSNSGKDTKGFLPAYFLVVLFYYLATEILALLNFYESTRVHTIFKLLEIISYNFLLSQLLEQTIVSIVGLLFIMMIGIEFITYETDYDKSTILLRKIIFSIAMGVNLAFVIGTQAEGLWLISFLADFFVVICVCFTVDWLAGQSDTFDRQKDELYVKLGELDDANSKLIEFHDRMKAVNEQINYQKIDLSRANREMEETNRDIIAQTDVLQYIVSSFDIAKCVEVMATSIVDVRKAKLCAIYLPESKYYDDKAICVIKSDISTLERKLKKTIDVIYTEFVAEHKSPVIYEGSELSKYQFIGDLNIQTMAIIPMLEKHTTYGFMIVASNDDRYFAHGTSKFDADIIGLRLALKNIGMYLDMQKMARHDGLTGIYNRLYFTELFAASCKKAVRKNLPISIALFDIDHFKRVNDTYGHLTGDEVLIAVAHTVDALANKYDGYCCRFGGEEFLVVLPDYEEKQALEVFEELHNDIKAIRVSAQDQVISLDVCIGMTTYPSICDNTNTMISRADKAMYYGKEHGRGRLIVDSKDLDK